MRKGEQSYERQTVVFIQHYSGMSGNNLLWYVALIRYNLCSLEDHWNKVNMFACLLKCSQYPQGVRPRFETDIEVSLACNRSSHQQLWSLLRCVVVMGEGGLGLSPRGSAVSKHCLEGSGRA